MYDAILVPTDGSEGANAAAEHAIDIARATGATLHVIHVVDVRMTPITPEMDPETALDVIENSRDRPTTAVLDRADESGVETVEAIRVGVPHEEILEYVDEEGIDLVVMGTHGRTGLDRYLLGSVTERVVRAAGVPVLATPLAGRSDVVRDDDP